MKSQRLKKLMRWSVRITPALVVLLALFILEEHVRGRIMLARHKAELRVKGEKLTLTELDLPAPPKEKNGAAALLVAADALGAATNANPLSQYRLAWTQFAAPGRVVVLCHGEQLGYWWFPTHSWDELSKDLAVVSNALKMARAAAREPTLTVELDYRKGNELRLPHYAKIRPLREWLAVAALEALRRNDLDIALENIAGISGLMRLQKDDHLLGLQNFRLWTANIGLQVTWEALQTEGWTEQQLAKLQNIWQAAECLPDFLPSMEMDRVLCIQAYNRDTLKDLLDGLNFGCYYNEELKQGWDYWMDTSLLTAHWLVWRAAWFDQDQLRTLRIWQNNLDGARAVVEQKSWAAWPVMRERRWTFYDRWRYLLYGTSYGCDLEMKEAAKYETLREMTVAAIALKRYQLRIGKLPSDLSALVPEFLPALPHDWMDGKPLHYRLNADGTFTLYSVGLDGVDDGGDPNPPNPKGSYRMWFTRDAVWPAPATQADMETWKLKWLQRAGQAKETGRGRRLTAPR